LLSQFGLRVKYTANDYPGWDELVREKFNTSQELFSSGLEFGVDYWFRLKNVRIEFLPEVAYSMSTSNANNDFVKDYKWQAWHFNFNTHIYLMDLLGDCDCPTFSKDGPGLTKGFFIAISPGVGFTNNNLSLAETDALDSSKDNYFKIGFGMGFDVGINDLLTISPNFMYNYASSVNWENFESNQDILDWNSGAHTSKMQQIQFGLRLGFRPDYVKRN
jgi:hypothetical protein